MKYCCKFKFKHRSYLLNELLVLACSFFAAIDTVPVIVERQTSSYQIGPCIWARDRPCPDNDIKFYLFTRHNPEDRQYIHIDETLESSNLTTSYFDPAFPIKIIIHGYNSDMYLEPLIQMKSEYLKRGHYNLFYVDWSVLAQSPCYPIAVSNVRHVGECVAQLVRRIRETGTHNFHLIGFSLGAHVPNFAANALKEHSIILPRITGLDPAMPLFITSPVEDKLDPSDADFVDVIHTNALIQGKIEKCGHVDFYMNGGIVQPGCWSMGRNPFACSHQRAPDYFSESIRSLNGFWGYACESYISYLLGLCPLNNNQVVAGEDTLSSTRGLYLVQTNAVAPFAIGRIPVLSKKHGILHPNSHLVRFRDPLQKEIDQWGKLDGDFNNLEQFPTPYSQDPNGHNWIYFDDKLTTPDSNKNQV